MKRKDHELAEKGASLQGKILERGGQNLLFIVICFLLVVLAAPLLLVFLIKSPEPDQHILILGVSYYKLVFIYFLSAAIMVYTSLFFLRANPLTIFLVFILSLFCCFPLIVGLRNNLTLHQAIINPPLFASWPFFLKPAYILIEFLLPVGIVIYLLLQIKSIFSKKFHTYAFFSVAVYLFIAAFLGFSGLIQAEQPNIVSAFAREKGDLVQKDMAAVFPGTSPQDFSSGKDDIQSSRSSTLPIVEAPNHPEPESTVSKPRLQVATKNPPPDKTAMVELEQKVQLLSAKADRIIEELGQVKNLFTDRQKNFQDKKSSAVVQKKGIQESGSPTATKKPPVNTRAIAELQKDVRLLSDKVDNILDGLGRMAKLLPEPQEEPQKDEAMVEEKGTDE
ncbi:MAG: hypothetical protein HWN69_03415 [Desulfobacterales bacterium]|nr:hypothetical protein [Desulfobacterales bacterium]